MVLLTAVHQKQHRHQQQHSQQIIINNSDIGIRCESQPDTGMDAQYTISVERATIEVVHRLKKGVVDKLPQNTSVVVSGQTDDATMEKHGTTLL